MECNLEKKSESKIITSKRWERLKYFNIHMLWFPIYAFMLKFFGDEWNICYFISFQSIVCIFSVKNDMKMRDHKFIINYCHQSSCPSLSSTSTSIACYHRVLALVALLAPFLPFVFCDQCSYISKKICIQSLCHEIWSTIDLLSKSDSSFSAAFSCLGLTNNPFDITFLVG